jgi:Acyl-CoA dehydrogenases
MSDTATATVAAITDASPAATPLPLADVITEIAARREEFERLSHVPRDVIASLKRAGVYRAATPRRFGGDALAPGAFLDMIERIAVADGSAAMGRKFRLRKRVSGGLAAGNAGAHLRRRSRSGVCRRPLPPYNPRSPPTAAGV